MQDAAIGSEEAAVTSRAFEREALTLPFETLARTERSFSRAHATLESRRYRDPVIPALLTISSMGFPACVKSAICQGLPSTSGFVETSFQAANEVIEGNADRSAESTQLYDVYPAFAAFALADEALARPSAQPGGEVYLGKPCGLAHPAQQCQKSRVFIRVDRFFHASLAALRAKGAWYNPKWNSPK